jgi:hypothetical protein
MKARLFKYLAMMLGCSIAVGALCVAQETATQGKKPAKENSEAVWKVQAQSVADQLGLTKDQTAKLTTAYLTARASHKQSLKELPEEKDKDKARVALQGAIEKDQAAFLSSLKGTLSPETLSKLTTTLGSFNGRWDGYTTTLLELKLDAATMKTAMGFLITYVSDYEGASKESLKSFNRRPNSRSFKQKLDTDLAGLLKADQIKKWNEATAMTGGKEKGAAAEKK